MGNQQLDAIEAAGANRGSEWDVTVRVGRVDDAWGPLRQSRRPGSSSPSFDCHDKLLAQHPSAHAMRSRYFVLR